MISSFEVRLAVTLYFTIALAFCLWLLPEAAKDPDVRRVPGLGVMIFVLLVFWPATLIAVYIHNERKRS